VNNDGFNEDSPNHDPDATYEAHAVKTDDIINNLSPEDQQTFNDLFSHLGDVKDEQSGQTAIDDMSKFLEQHGMSVKGVEKAEDGVLRIHWEEPGHSGYAEGVVEHAAETAADWQKDVPGLHEENVKTIQDNDNIKTFNEAHPTMAVDVNRLEMILMLSGAQAVPAGEDSHQIIDHDGQKEGYFRA
jgi:hypothetical protein